MISRQEKTYALLAYLTFIGLIAAYFLNGNKKYPFVNYHIKNMFGLVILLFISQTLQTLTDPRLGEFLWILSFALWTFSIASILFNRKTAIPILSNYFQKWFSFLD
jgi:hypothetical protein